MQIEIVEQWQGRSPVSQIVDLRRAIVQRPASRSSSVTDIQAEPRNDRGSGGLLRAGMDNELQIRWQEHVSLKDSR
jgi:hypothetical protein